MVFGRFDQLKCEEVVIQGNTELNQVKELQYLGPLNRWSQILLN